MNSHEINLAGGENAVLLIHGLTGSPFELKYLAKRLNKAGFTVKAPCLAGHGTTMEDLKKTRWPDWYGTVVDSFQELKKTHASVAVSGLCMGAVLALHLASEAKDEVSGISLLSTTLFYDGWSLPWFKFLLPLVYYTPLRSVATYTEREPYGIKNERLRKQILKGLKDNAIGYSKFPCTGMYELLKLVRTVKKNLREVTAPALILHSLEDDVASIKNADYIEKHIGSKNVHKILLNDSYHMIPLDNQREFASEEMIKFFRKCSAESGKLLNFAA